MKSQKRILHLIPNLSGGGMERRMGIIAKESCKNFSVHVAYISEGPNNKDISLGKVNLHRIKIKNNYDPRLLFEIFFLITKLRPVFIQTWSIQMDIVGGLLALITRHKHILMEPISPQDNNSKKFDFKQFFKEIIAKNAIVISNSNLGKIYWEAKRARKSLLIRNGFDIEEIINVKEKLPKDLERFLCEDKFIVVASRLSKTSIHKQINVILKTYKNIININPDLKLVICGGGPLQNKYEKIVIEYGIKSKVFFTGFIKRQKLWCIFKKASLFISLSRFEGMPNSVIEAALCRTPLFLSAIPTHLEVIPKNMAYFTSNYNSLDLGTQILNYLENSKMIKRRADELFKKVNKYSTEFMIKEYINIYKQFES
tara:strand:+ start:1913 stop:3022 length:1110 start_codon:yes stop_codon:yes gene_type:complete